MRVGPSVLQVRKQSSTTDGQLVPKTPSRKAAAGWLASSAIDFSGGGIGGAHLAGSISGRSAQGDDSELSGLVPAGGSTFEGRSEISWDSASAISRDLSGVSAVGGVVSSETRQTHSNQSLFTIYGGGGGGGGGGDAGAGAGGIGGERAGPGGSTGGCGTESSASSTPVSTDDWPAVVGGGDGGGGGSVLSSEVGPWVLAKHNPPPVSPASDQADDSSALIGLLGRLQVTEGQFGLVLGAGIQTEDQLLELSKADLDELGLSIGNRNRVLRHGRAQGLMAKSQAAAGPAVVAGAVTHTPSGGQAVDAQATTSVAEGQVKLPLLAVPAPNGQRPHKPKVRPAPPPSPPPEPEPDPAQPEAQAQAEAEPQPQPQPEVAAPAVVDAVAAGGLEMKMVEQVAAVFKDGKIARFAVSGKLWAKRQPGAATGQPVGFTVRLSEGMNVAGETIQVRDPQHTP